jgi:hypothetical protein
MTDLLHGVVDLVHVELDALLSRRDGGATEATSIPYTVDALAGEKIRSIPRVEWHEESFSIDQDDTANPDAIATWVGTFDVVVVAYSLRDARNLVMNLVQALYSRIGANNFTIGSGDVESQAKPENSRRGHVMAFQIDIRIPIPCDPLPIGAIEPAGFELTQSVAAHEQAIDLIDPNRKSAFSSAFSTAFG